MENQETRTIDNTRSVIRNKTTAARFDAFSEGRLSYKKKRTRRDTSRRKYTDSQAPNSESYAHIAEQARQHNIPITDEDISLLLRLQGRENEEPFPVGMFLVAFIKDMLDIFLTFTIVGIVLILPFSFFISLVLFLWIRGRLQGGWYKKKMIKFAWRRFFIMLGIESLPLFGIIPANNLFVYMVHKRETLIVRTLNDTMEYLHRNTKMRHR